MILLTLYSSKGTLGTVFGTICEAVISLLGGCPGTDTPLLMSIPHSSSAISADCNGLLRAACPKQPRDCPICSRSGISTSACQGQARRFLAACFGTGHLDWSSLQAQQISDFVQQEAANKHGGGRKLPSTAVRSLLRFLVFSGERSSGLEAVALPPRQWPHDSIPKRLTAQEVE